MSAWSLLLLLLVCPAVGALISWYLPLRMPPVVLFLAWLAAGVALGACAVWLSS